MTPQNVVESGNRAPVRISLKAQIARVLLEALSTECQSYCILSGYERLPDGFDTDIDFMVGQEDFERMPRIMEEVARKTGTRLFQSIDHEVTGRAYFLGSLDGPTLTIVQPDCAGDYRHVGRRWLSAKEVLKARRLHANGIYIPSVAHEFAYSLIKRLNMRSFNREHGYRLHRLYVEDRIECGRMIARFVRGPEGSQIVRMASANDWTAMYDSMGPFRAAMLRSRRESFEERLADLPRKALNLVRRVVQPTGCWIALMGPQVDGKSHLLTAIGQEFAPSFRAIRYYQLRPGLIGRKTGRRAAMIDSRGQREPGTMASIAKVLHFWLDYNLGHLFRILPRLVRTEMQVFDRCFYDLLVDSRRFRYAGPPWLLRVAARLSPRPDLVIVLDTPAEGVRGGNQDITAEEAARQRAAYLELARSLGSSVVVNAAQPTDNTVHDTLAAILVHLGERTKRRLRITSAPQVPGGASPHR